MTFERFIRISKVDPDQRMVWGYASTPDLDSQGERVTLKAIEDSLDDYMRFANIREMHQASAVGKTKSAEVDEKGLYIGAKIVDEVAWLKVKEGVYSGFSIGGEVVSKVDDEIRALRLFEISLVDRPANPKALFDVWKRDRNRDGGTKMNLKKYGGPENGTEDDIVKLLDSSAASVEKAGADRKALLEKNAGLEKQIAELKAASGDTIALQIKLETLEREKEEREKKDKAASCKKLIDGAIAAGKIRAEKRADWEKVFETSGEAVTTRLLADAPVVVPIGQRIGSGGEGEDSTEGKCRKVIEKIMNDEKLPFDQAYSKAYQRNPKLFQLRDREQLAASSANGHTYGGDSE